MCLSFYQKKVLGTSNFHLVGKHYYFSLSSIMQPVFVYEKLRQWCILIQEKISMF